MAEADSDSRERKGAQDPDPLLAAIGKRLREVRTSRHLGVTEAATRAGMKKGHLWRVEAGQHNLSVKVLARLAVALDTTMSDLLAGVSAQQTPMGSNPD